MDAFLAKVIIDAASIRHRHHIVSSRVPRGGMQRRSRIPSVCVGAPLVPSGRIANATSIMYSSSTSTLTCALWLVRVRLCFLCMYASVCFRGVSHALTRYPAGEPPAVALFRAPPVCVVCRADCDSRLAPAGTWPWVRGCVAARLPSSARACHLALLSAFSTSVTSVVP